MVDDGQDVKPEASEQEQAHESGCGCGCGSGDMPPVTFRTFILSLSSSAMVHLGEVPDPESGQAMANLQLAKHTIDILAMLKDKTARCVTEEEGKLLDGLLYELRMAYLKKA